MPNFEDKIETRIIDENIAGLKLIAWAAIKRSKYQAQLAKELHQILCLLDNPQMISSVLWTKKEN